MLREIAAAVVLLCVAFAAGWTVNGWRRDKELVQVRLTYETQRAAAETQARAKEQDWADQAAAIRKNKDAEIATVSRKLNSTLAGLRSRPERPSGAVSQTSRACAGSSGAELARGDGEFLAGYSADAAKLSAALDQCEAQYNQLRK